MPTNNFKVGEMLNKRTRNSKTWMNFDGSYTTEIHSGDVHFEDEHGNLQNINTDLYDEADFDVIDDPVSVEGKERFAQAQAEAKTAKKQNLMNRSNHNFQALRVPFDAHIPRNFQRGYTIGKGQDKLTFKPVKSSPSTGEPSADDRSVITYQDVWNDTDVELKVQPNGLKETLYLKTDRAPSSFSFEVKGKDIADDFTAGALQLMPAWLVDAEGTYRDVEQKVVRQNDNKMYVELNADVTDLVYPIAIDPTVTIRSFTDEANVYGSNPGANYLKYLRAHASFNYEQNRHIFIRPDLSSVPSEAYVVSAYLYLRRKSTSGDGYLRVIPKRVLSSWDEETLTFQNKPDSISDGNGASTFSDMYNAPTFFGIYTTNSVRKMINGTNYGFELETQNNIVVDGYRTIGFYNSTEGVNFAPYMEISYNIPPTKPALVKPNGGENRNAEHTIEWEASTDPEGDPIEYEIQLSTDDGANWKTLIGLTSGTSYTYDFTDEPETSTALIRIRAYDGTSYSDWDVSDGVFTIQHNFAPGTPINLSPSGGTIKDRANAIRLSWTHNDPNDSDPQSKFDLQWRKKGASTWNDVSQVMVNEYYDLTGLAHGDHEWRVRTYDQEGLSSPYSNIALFLAGDKPSAPTITDPTNGATVPVANPTVKWSASGQTAYKLDIKDSAGTVVWTTERTSTNKAVTANADLANQTDYTIELSIKNKDGLWSNKHIIVVTVSYTPPATPTIDVSGQGTSIQIAITNPEPVDTQPSVAYHDIFKRIDGAWTRIASSIPVNGTYEDYAVASERDTEYKARAISTENDTYSDSVSASASIKLKGVYVHSVQDPAGTLQRYLFDGGGRSSAKQVEHQYRRFAGRTKQVVEFGEMLDYSISVGIRILRDDEGGARLEEFVEKKETICYRDGRGRLLFGTITAAPLNDTNFGEDTTIDVMEIDYSEEV